MYSRGLWLIFFLLTVVPVFGQGKITRAEYIEMYAELAMSEMVRSGVPASITLAQGCLESDNGNSTLAVKANNHFGIKCHDWTGRRIYHDDDTRNECFRRYRTVLESFIDHSDFLTMKTRYAALFTLRSDDYRGWARGLKSAGYATSSRYADLLIMIIEDNELYRYDQMVLSGNYTPGADGVTMVPVGVREILTNNRVEYVITEPGDTPESLRKTMDLYPREIYRYNNISKGERLELGTIIYLQPKRFRAERGNETHVVQEGETMWDISQFYGVKLNRLYRLNDLSKDHALKPGTTIWLRNRKPPDQDAIFYEEEEPSEEPVKLEFEFDGR
ncbi:MAG: glucosaminidase domain-containing protein [Bacteroidales bacterium]